MEHIARLQVGQQLDIDKEGIKAIATAFVEAAVRAEDPEHKGFFNSLAKAIEEFADEDVDTLTIRKVPE